MTDNHRWARIMVALVLAIASLPRADASTKARNLNIGHVHRVPHSSIRSRKANGLSPKFDKAAKKTIIFRRGLGSSGIKLGVRLGLGLGLGWGLQGRVFAAEDNKVAYLEKAARGMYGELDFPEAIRVLSELIETEPDNFKWFAARAEVYVDLKDFDRALEDYNSALHIRQNNPTGQSLTDAGFEGRLLAGRGLAYEGKAMWKDALRDYDRALALAVQEDVNPDPYVLNSRGNCHASLSEWEMARKDYLSARDAFQKAKGFRGEGGSTTQRLDGAIYAASNAALMLAQMGNEEAATKEMVTIARRGPGEMMGNQDVVQGSVDIRAALASMYWKQGREDEAREIWQYACERINAGCGKYFDMDWVARIRRWPPVMVSMLDEFIKSQKLGE